MNGRKAKLLRKEARENGTAIKPKQLFAPFTVPIMQTNIKTGEKEPVETYIPRRQRRALQRAWLTALRKGRINLNDRNQ